MGARCRGLLEGRRGWLAMRVVRTARGESAGRGDSGAYCYCEPRLCRTSFLGACVLEWRWQCGLVGRQQSSLQMSMKARMEGTRRIEGHEPLIGSGGVPAVLTCNVKSIRNPNDGIRYQVTPMLGLSRLHSSVPNIRRSNPVPRLLCLFKI